MANNDEKILFSNRLNELCEEKNLPEDGRQQILKAVCKTTQQAVSKWFLGEAVPKHENRIALCEYFNVKYEWLATGRGVKRDNTLELVPKRELEIEEFITLLRQLPENDFHQVTDVGQNLARYLLKGKTKNGN